MKYMVINNFTESQFEIMTDEDDDVIVSCTYNDEGGPKGMDWIRMMLGERYGQPYLHALMRETAMMYTILPAGDGSTEVAKMDVISKKDEKRQVFGWAYLMHDKDGKQMVDVSGEAIADVEELEKAAYKFVITSRRQGDMHQRVTKDAPLVVGTMIESMVLTPEKAAAMGIPPGSVGTGWWVGFQVDDETTWNEIKKGTRKQFSIHGTGTKKAVNT